MLARKQRNKETSEKVDNTSATKAGFTQVFATVWLFWGFIQSCSSSITSKLKSVCLRCSLTACWIYIVQLCWDVLAGFSTKIKFLLKKHFYLQQVTTVHRSAYTILHRLLMQPSQGLVSPPGVIWKLSRVLGECDHSNHFIWSFYRI